MSQSLRNFILAFLIVVSCQHFAFTQCPSAKRFVRVAVVQDAASFRLKIRGYYEIINLVNQKVLFHGRNLNTMVTPDQDGILLGNHHRCAADKILIKTDNSDVININNRKFKGDLRVIKKSDARLVVINEINLEDYVKGILYNEASHYWPQEALKAQAIVCRSYATYQMQENTLGDFDLTSDIYSQVYGGQASERYRTNKAVLDTKDRVVVYQGKVIPAFYHATCGGHTEDASKLWKLDLPPLKGVVCNFCKESPHFNWHAVLSLGQIEEKLAASRNKISGIKEMIILGRDNSERISDLKIVAGRSELKISSKDFRNIIGPNLIRSTNFNLNIVNHDVVFEGFGWGHGVGLCQWGAYFMAKEGYTFREILQYYYPKAELK